MKNMVMAGYTKVYPGNVISNLIFKYSATTYLPFVVVPCFMQLNVIFEVVIDN